MNLESADKICQRALEVGHINKLKPLTVAVLDAGGHMISFRKEDGASLFREQVAKGKATAALGFGSDSAALEAVAEARPAFMNAAYSATGGQVIPVPGGVLIKDKEGKIIGAVGISGDLSEADEACAVAAIRAAGLFCDSISSGKECYLKAHL